MDDQQSVFTSNQNQYNQPANLPNATAALVLGIISIVGAFCYGLVGVICGIIGLILANKDRKLYQSTPELYSSSSFSSSNAGRICSIIGLILGGIVVLFFIIILIFAGSMSVWANQYR